MVGDGERVAVSSVTELELAFEVGAPQGINRGALRQRGTMRTVTRPAHALDQAMAIENGVDRAFGWNPDIASKPPDQEFADFARAPMRLVALETEDQAFDLLRQLVGIAHRPPRTVVDPNTNSSGNSQIFRDHFGVVAKCKLVWL